MSLLDLFGQETCQKILDSADQHPDDKSVIKHMIELTNPAGYEYCHKILPFLATRSKSRSVPHVAYSIFPTSFLPTSCKL